MGDPVTVDTEGVDVEGVVERALFLQQENGFCEAGGEAAPLQHNSCREREETEEVHLLCMNLCWVLFII